MEPKIKIHETGGADSVLPDRRGNTVKREIVIIEEGWGSSGYYGMDMLERDIPRIFPIGTHMYMDHPTESEDIERPERSVKDLAAVITSTPRKAGIRMVAEAEIVEHWEPVISALAENIGTSINANGIAEHGSAGGKEGPIIKSLTYGRSIDFVTKAGAGGKVGKMIESAREQAPDDNQFDQPIRLEEARNAAHWFEARIHRDFTMEADYAFGEGRLTREERIALSTAVGEALTAFSSSVEANAPGLLARDPYAEAPTGDVSVEETTEPDHTGSSIKESKMDQEKELSDLRESVRKLEASQDEASKRVDTLEADKKKEADRADEAEGKLRSIEAGRIVASALKDNDSLPAEAKKRAVESVLGGSLPLHEDGKLDSEKLKESALEAAKKEAEYIASINGETSASESTRVTTQVGGGSSAADGEAALTEAFQELGLDEDLAKVAAKGR